MKLVLGSDGHPVEQQSVDWAIARSGIPTASELGNLLTPEFAIRKGEMPKSYLMKKLAESWYGGPLASFNTVDMEIGKILENQAIPTYELLHDVKIQRTGLITTDDGGFGCSPDGLIGEDGGIEIKCPAPQTHIKYLIGGKLPDDYAPQVHGAMFVTGYKWWKFMSYCPGLPEFLITVHRDEKIAEIIDEVLGQFWEAFEFGMNKLIEANGGKRRESPNVRRDKKIVVNEHEVTP